MHKRVVLVGRDVDGQAEVAGLGGLVDVGDEAIVRFEPIVDCCAADGEAFRQGVFGDTVDIKGIFQEFFDFSSQKLKL